MMTREVYPDKKFTEFSRRQIFVRYFADTDPEGARLAKKFRVEGYPTLIVLDSDGDEVDRIEGALKAPDLIKELESIFRDARRAGPKFTL